MRSAVAVAAFAAGALAVPYKRDIVTDVEMVYATDIVTVYATQNDVVTATATAVATTYSTEAANAAPAASSESSASSAQHYGHHGGWTKTWTSQQTETSTSAAYVAPAPTSSSVYVAPTTSTSAVFVAPTTSSTTSTYVAPTTSSVASVPAYSAPSSSVQTPSSTVQSAAASATSYSDIVVLHHNVHRANHSADPLAWSDDLAKSAADIAASCVYAHNVDADGGGYGQNIAAGVEPTDISSVISDLFYNGEVGWFNGLYGQAQPDMTNFEHWGHFSQIVWKDTKFVGCATQHCPNGLANVGDDVAPYFTVCNYKGPGNYANEYGANIGASLNKATVGAKYGLSS